MKGFIGWCLIAAVFLGVMLRALGGIELTTPNAILDAGAIIAGSILLIKC